MFIISIDSDAVVLMKPPNTKNALDVVLDPRLVKILRIHQIQGTVKIHSATRNSIHGTVE